MSEEIKRYTIVGDDFEAVTDATGKWIRHDAATSQLAALREELVKFDDAMRALACNLGAGGYNAEFLTADQLASKVQWGIDNLLKVEQQRLADAERRNAECLALLRRSTAEKGEDFKAWWNARALILQAALNPNPEAAGHDE